MAHLPLQQYQFLFKISNTAVLFVFIKYLHIYGNCNVYPFLETTVQDGKPLNSLKDILIGDQAYIGFALKEYYFCMYAFRILVKKKMHHATKHCMLAQPIHCYSSLS